MAIGMVSGKLSTFFQRNKRFKRIFDLILVRSTPLQNQHGVSARLSRFYLTSTWQVKSDTVFFFLRCDVCCFGDKEPTRNECYYIKTALSTGRSGFAQPDIAVKRCPDVFASFILNGTEVASCLNLLTFFCLLCWTRQTVVLSWKLRCWFPGMGGKTRLVLYLVYLEIIFTFEAFYQRYIFHCVHGYESEAAVFFSEHAATLQRLSAKNTRCFSLEGLLHVNSFFCFNNDFTDDLYLNGKLPRRIQIENKD